MKQLKKLEDEKQYMLVDGEVVHYANSKPSEFQIIYKVNELVDEINKLKRKRPTKKQHAKWVKKYQ